MTLRLVPFILSLSLAAPAVVLGGACCPSEHAPSAGRVSAEACCCRDTLLCGSDAATESLLEARLVAPDSSHYTSTVFFLTTDLSRVRSVTGSRPFRLASARAPTPAPLTMTLPLRL